MSILSNIFGDANKRFIDKLQSSVVKINSLEKSFESFSTEKIRTQTQDFKDRFSGGEDLDKLLPEAFALVREAAKRTLGQRHFDVQLMGGIVLHQGKIAEMKTGEGKTLVATLAGYLNALSGRGVHIVTVNDYLARRDVVWMGQVYHLLGLSIGCINNDASYIYDPEHIIAEGLRSKDQSQKNKILDKERDAVGGFKVVHEFLRPVTRKEAYAADITYGTNNEFGFDYLRDNLVYSADQQVQSRSQVGDSRLGWAGGYNYAIVDEVDSILIDESRTPLIISSPDSESTQLYETFSKIVPYLVNGEDFTVDEKLKSVLITEKGIEKVEQALGMKNIYDHGGMRYVHHLEQALRAHVLYHRDKDYVVKGGEVIIVDEFTGRLMPGRRWSEGLHQAVEAKEKVKVQKESRTFATVTFQNYFRLYKKLAGMTGTATTSAEEFHKVYKLEVISIPTNKSLIREDLPDRIYKTHNAKWNAVVEEIKIRNANGQPLLVGTTSIEKNELLSIMLQREGIKHEILNAKNHEREAQIIAQAGKSFAVTIATNMAGRGVDIILGGNPPSSDETQKVKDIGGLHVIATERHDARRIDNQLRGRAGRQGDTGSTQFFISLEDDLVRIFGGERIKALMDRFGIPDDQAIEHSLISKAIEQAQNKVEGHNFDARKYVLEFDDVMNKHRETIYRMRQETLETTERKQTKQKILDFFEETIDSLVNQYSALPDSDLNKLNDVLFAISGAKPEIANLENFSGQELKAKISNFLIEQYSKKEEHEGVDTMHQIEKFVLLRTIDELWVDHLETMEYLRDSVNLRAYGQRDPLVEYKIEGQKLFDQLLSSIANHVTQLIFKVGQTQQSEQTKDLKIKDQSRNSNLALDVKHSSLDNKKMGRNDPCPCGAKDKDGHPIKYKRCHGR